MPKSPKVPKYFDLNLDPSASQVSSIKKILFDFAKFWIFSMSGELPRMCIMNLNLDQNQEHKEITCNLSKNVVVKLTLLIEDR